MPPLIPPSVTGYPRNLLELSVQQKTREAYAIAGFCKLTELVGSENGGGGVYTISRLNAGCVS